MISDCPLSSQHDRLGHIFFVNVALDDLSDERTPASPELGSKYYISHCTHDVLIGGKRGVTRLSSPLLIVQASFLLKKNS